MSDSNPTERSSQQPPIDGNVAVFFVARLNSSRLPRKVLLPIAGKPLILHQIERMKLAKLPSRFVLCTTDSPLDDDLAKVAGDAGIEVFRGPELDVPRRLLGAAEQFGAELFLLCEADEHYVDPDHVDAIIEYASQHGGDWIHIHGNPIGAWVRGISRHAMRTLCSEMQTEGLDGWGAFFEKDPRFALGDLRLLSEADSQFADTVRLTIDYPEDFKLAEALYGRLYAPGKPLRLASVLQALKDDPALVDINLHRQDQYWERLKAQSQGLVT